MAGRVKKLLLSDTGIALAGAVLIVALVLGR